MACSASLGNGHRARRCKDGATDTSGGEGAGAQWVEHAKAMTGARRTVTRLECGTAFRFADRKVSFTRRVVSTSLVGIWFSGRRACCRARLLVMRAPSGIGAATMIQRLMPLGVRG